MRGHTINQQRAIAHHLKLHPELKIAMGVAGLTVGFTDRITGKTEDKTLAALENNYNQYRKHKEDERKSMKKELKVNGHTIKPKPRTIRPSRGGTQISLTGDDSPEGDA